MAERLLFLVVLFLLAGPFVMFLIPEGPLRDRFVAFWAQSYLRVLYFGFIAGGFMSVVLVFRKLAEA